MHQLAAFDGGPRVLSLHKLWRRSSAASTGQASADLSRWVVLDVETTGLDPQRASLLAVAAVAVRVDFGLGKCSLLPNDSFERMVRPVAASADDGNVLLHGIGRAAQRDAQEPELVLTELSQYCAGAPLLAFHAGFDRVMLDRACKAARLLPLARQWLDIADLCRVLWPDQRLHGLDEWLDHFGLVCPQRHQAASDAWVEAELLQIAWPLLAKECKSFADLLALSKQARWLG